MISTEIDSRTGLLGIIGDPIEHALSPKMHNFLLERAGLNFCYLAFRVGKEKLRGALEGMRSLGIRGLNVTAPHKEQVVIHLDELTAEAQALGAVNTIILTDEGRLIGCNTDPSGFEQSLRAQRLSLEGWSVVILGAGGGAAAVAWALIELGAARIAIYSRTPTRAEALASRLAISTSTPISARSIADRRLEDDLAHAQLLVNATPAGTFPHTDEIVIEPELLHDGLVVYDLVYNPPKTKLLQEAEARGARIINGLDMLIYQGLKSFEIWTGIRFAQDVATKLKAYLQQAVQNPKSNV